MSTRIIRAGLHAHRSGWLIVRSDGWGASERQERWETARWRDGSIEVDGPPSLHRTLRAAVRELELCIHAGTVDAVIDPHPDSPWSTAGREAQR